MAEFVWSPKPAFIESTNIARFMRKHDIRDEATLVARSLEEQEWFWDAIVEDLGIEFLEPYNTVRDVSKGYPWTEWYLGGTLNITANCLERHLGGGLAARACVIAEREDGAVTTLTFAELHDQVERCAAGLVAAGIQKGDRVAAYMPMTADVVVQMLATFKIGAIYIPIFSGYAPAAAAERLRDAGAKLLFTADASQRRGVDVPIKGNADAAVEEAPSVTTVVMSRYTDEDVVWYAGRDVAWPEFLSHEARVPTEAMDSMDPALILYTSGTSGRPKGTVHSHAGTLVQVAKEVGYAFDMKPSDRFFWLTDIGWMMGPWMIIGGLFHGATIMLYDGSFDSPSHDRLWEMLERHRITVFGTSPTAVRLAIQHGTKLVNRHDLSTLRILGSTGEPWDERSWRWFFHVVGGSRCPIINISGGTDIIGCFLSPLPIHPLKPCSLVAPGLGMAIDVWNEDGQPVRNEVGYLVATKPTPSMTRGLWNDPDRYLESYWSKWPDVWNHGDWARIDEDGYWFVEGRADDTLNVAGRRIGPAEIEGALMATDKISEAAAIGVPHELKGEAIVCFVVPRPDVEATEGLRSELVQAVVGRVGKIDRPERVLFVSDLPKTRSAKVVRRLVRDTYLGQKDLGDLASLQNPEALEAIARAT
jgi:acetyl-CoA synthetase